MLFDKLTLRAQEVLQEAQEMASHHGKQQIEPLHLLAALLVQREGIVAPWDRHKAPSFDAHALAL